DVCSSDLLRGVAADLQQGEHEGGELVAERDTRELDLDVGADPADQEGGATGGFTVAHMSDQIGHAGDLIEEVGEFLRLRPVVEGRHELDRLGDLFEKGLQLGSKGGIEHEDSLQRWKNCDRKRWESANFSARAERTRTVPGGTGLSIPCHRNEFPSTNQILPTSSSDGARVSSPSSHLAGQTSPGWLRTY